MSRCKYKGIQPEGRSLGTWGPAGSRRNKMPSHSNSLFSTYLCPPHTYCLPILPSHIHQPFILSISSLLTHLKTRLLVQAWNLASELISLPSVYYVSVSVYMKCSFRVKHQGKLCFSPGSWHVYCMRKIKTLQNKPGFPLNFGCLEAQSQLFRLVKSLKIYWKYILLVFYSSLSPGLEFTF